MGLLADCAGHPALSASRGYFEAHVYKYCMLRVFDGEAEHVIKRVRWWMLALPVMNAKLNVVICRRTSVALQISAVF